jgi:hypothetical protein
MLWTLTDVDRDVYVDQLTLGPRDVGDSDAHYSVRKRKLRGGLRAGIDVVEVDNGRLRFTVLPDRGMGLWRAWLGDLQLGWQSPVKGPVHPTFVPLFEPSGIGWLQGFDELVCRCGLESNGAPERGSSGELQLPLHGRIANLPAHLVEVSIDGSNREISVRGVVDEARIFCNCLRLDSTVTTQAEAPWLRVIDRVTNVSGEPAELELLYHINLGSPLLVPGTKLHAPIRELAPRDSHSATDISTWSSYGAAQAGSQEFAHFAQLATDERGQTRVLLEFPGGERGVSLVFDHRQLPCFTLWKSQRLPGDGYVTGLEPGINFPNVKSFERQQGRVARLEPGESRQFEFELHAYDTAESVRQAAAKIATVAAQVTPQIHAQPKPEWSAA